MTKLWLFIIVALFIQEPASTDAAIFLIRQEHLNLWLIHLIWLIATTIDISLGFIIGKWVQQKFKKTRIVAWSEKWATRIESFVGKRGERFAIVLLGIINFPYFNAFLISWLKLPFRNLFVLIFIGDSIYWIVEWIINLSVRNYIANPHTALYAVIGIGLVLSILSKTIMTKVLKKEPNR